MLINIFGKRTDRGDFQFEVPNTILDQRFNYKVAVTNVNFELMPTKTEFLDNELLCLNTNLVDLSGFNPRQTIEHLPYNNKCEIQHHQPTIVLHHTLQIYNLENASFTITRVKEQRALELLHIFIQLEISRKESYGRF